MIIIPAIDLLDGDVVRLEQGDYKRKKVYSKNPVEVAGKWKKAGAKLIHVVDLNGARDGRPGNLDIVKKIINEVPGIEIEFGGGIRTLKILSGVFAAGVSKAVLGTAAVKDADFSKICFSEYESEPEKIIFSIDMKNIQVVMDGWKVKAADDFQSLIERWKILGLRRLIYTDVLKDGMLSGPNIHRIKKNLKIANLEVIAAGGISSIGDIKALKALEKEGLKGVIIGTALYEKKIDLGEAILAVR